MGDTLLRPPLCPLEYASPECPSTLPPLPQQHSHPGLVSGTSSLGRTHLLMLSNGSKTRRLHVVTPAAQPVIIPCRRQSGSQSHLTAQADSGTEQGLTTKVTELHGAALHEAKTMVFCFPILSTWLSPEDFQSYPLL